MSNSSEYYCIRSDYIQKNKVKYCDKAGPQNLRKAIWQPWVYPIANEISNILKCSTLIDVGCGNGFKLVQFPSKNLIGIDIGDNIKYCKNTYPQYSWIEVDLELLDSKIDVDVTNSIVICADVIEHLLNPDPMMNLFRLWLEKGTKGIVLSTPARDIYHKKEHLGPPGGSHVREWNLDELVLYLKKNNLNVAWKGLTHPHDDPSTRKCNGLYYTYDGYGSLPRFCTSLVFISYYNLQLDKLFSAWVSK